MKVCLELRHCSLKLKHIGTQEELDLHEWCQRKKLAMAPLVKRGPRHSKSPNTDILKEGFRTSVRYCKTCQKETVFKHRLGWKHSKCTECNQTFSKSGRLKVKMNKCFYPKRYIQE